MASSSSNPFRKKATQHKENRFPPIEHIDTSHIFPAKTSFRDDGNKPTAAAAAAAAAVGGGGARGSDKRTKVVKKVRVLSPPPRSPDEPEWPADALPPGEFFASTYIQDPFDAAVSDDSGQETTSTPPPLHPACPQAQTWPNAEVRSSASVHVPANPFSKKELQDVANSTELKEDMRKEGEVLKAANTARRSLNVDAFRRLLLTGEASPPSSPPSTGTSSEQEQTETQATSPESKVASAITQTSREKKAPPPPPSSRHGKSLKVGPREAASETVVNLKEELSTSLPELSHQVGNTNESASSPELVENASEAESPRQPTPEVDQLNPTSTIAPHNGKKPVPAPPPRRGHARAESKALTTSSTPRAARSTSNPQDSDPPSRSSLDSTISRSGSIRHNLNAPAPPPPRRLQVGSKQPNTTPPSSTPPASQPPIQHSDSDQTTSLESTAIHNSSAGQPKSFAPPPPPARQPSTRRPSSIHNIEGASRRISAEEKPRDSMAPPPPPPSRHRGNSQSSMDAPTVRTSLDGASQPRVSTSGHDGLRDASLPPVQPAANIGKSGDILADLDALQREVDALRGKMS